MLVEAYLRLKPDDEKMLALQGQVEDRLDHDRARHERQEAEQQATQRRKEARQQAAHRRKLVRLIKSAAVVGGVALLVVVIGLSWNAWRDAQQVAAERLAMESVLTFQETLTLKGHSGYVYSVNFSPDGKRIVSGSSDNTLKVWDISLLDSSK